jgi:hypothetical protein
MKYRMKFFIAALQKKHKQFSKFDSIAEIPFLKFQLPIFRFTVQLTLTVSASVSVSNLLSIYDISAIVNQLLLVLM